MIREVDTLIAGAGPAGCAAAYDLAQAGKHVILLDKRSFPRHKPCACGLTRKTLKALRYSVDPVIERVCNEIVLQSAEAATTEPDSRRARSTVRVKTRNPICAMAVRERFDDFCLQQTLLAARQGGSIELRKIDRIVAAVDDGELQASSLPNPALHLKLAELEKANQDLKAQSATARRKTLSPMVTALLAKEGVEGDAVIETPIVEKALAGLSIEQRIAVKAELARAGILA